MWNIQQDNHPQKSPNDISQYVFRVIIRLRIWMSAVYYY